MIPLAFRHYIIDGWRMRVKEALAVLLGQRHATVEWIPEEDVFVAPKKGAKK